MKSQSLRIALSLLVGLIIYFTVSLLVSGQEASPPSAADVSQATDQIASLISGVFGKYGWLPQVLMIMSLLRCVFKPITTYLENYVKSTPGTEDDERLARIERGPIFKTVAFLLDFGASIKIKGAPGSAIRSIALASLLSPLLLTACQRLSYQSPTGEKFTRSAFGTKTSFSSLSVDISTNGVKRITLRGYQNDQVEALGLVAEKVAEGAVKGAASAAAPH